MTEEKYFVVFHGPSDGSEKSLEMIAAKLAASDELKSKKNIKSLLINPPAVVVQGLKKIDAESWTTLIESLGGIAEFLEGEVPELSQQSSSALPTVSNLSIADTAPTKSSPIKASGGLSLEGDSGSKKQVAPTKTHIPSPIQAEKKEGFDLENHILDSLHNAPTTGVLEASAKFTERRLYGEVSDDTTTSDKLPIVKNNRTKILAFGLIGAILIAVLLQFGVIEDSEPEMHITLNKDVLDRFIKEQEHILGRKKTGEEEKLLPYWKGEVQGVNFTTSLVLKTNDTFPQTIDIELFGKKSEAPTPAEYAAGILDHPWLFKAEAFDAAIELDHETKTEVVFKFKNQILLFISYLDNTNRVVGQIVGEIQLNKSNNLLTGSFQASYRGENLDHEKWYQIEKTKDSFDAFLREDFILNKREKDVVVAEAESEIKALFLKSGTTVSHPESPKKPVP